MNAVTMAQNLNFDSTSRIHSEIPSEIAEVGKGAITTDFNPWGKRLTDVESVKTVFFSFVFVLALITPVQTCFVCLTSVQLFAWRICVKTRLVSTKISDWHVRLERKHMCTAIILNKRNVCLWICLDSKRLAHWEDTSKHNEPMTIDSQNGRKINTKTNSGLGMNGSNSILWFPLSFYGKQTVDFCLFSLIDDLISAWRDHMSMAGGFDAIGWVLGQNSFCPNDIEKTHPGENRNVGIYKQASSDRTR